MCGVEIGWTIYTVTGLFKRSLGLSVVLSLDFWTSTRNLLLSLRFRIKHHATTMYARLTRAKKVQFFFVVIVQSKLGRESRM